MAAPRRLLLLPAVLLVLAAGAGALLPRPLAAAEGAKKVSLELYYETLCPYCSRFIVKRLALIFEDGLTDAVDLRLVPYGNARVESNGDISCQHGPEECMLNTVEACAIDAWPDLDVHFRFINCVENQVVKGQYDKWASCFQKLGLDTEPITDCYNGGQGYKLDLKYANQTDALVPPHRYVPWVVVDGQPLLEDYENFEAYVCKAYKGKPPKICQGLVHPAKARSGVTYNSGGIKLARHL
ncbi:Gamma-interferon-inducible lysosomal thiol reductase [Dichanthelium oligosanthes]|uniref:Gamma-interferon-inducible lysosomal thiol reductase n=1 Tax=Dichanthelium oligosanthes TaxID=888268 RepID=A0A1E5VWQ8_9POAL|nr:Gamma-interferon-inducible lysosomal thiol reductase [Dichanthelium oligosanthes]